MALISLALATTLAVTAVASGAPPIQPVGPTPGDEGLTASLSTDKAGARPVVLTLKLRAVFQCGQPGMLSVKLPDSESVPAALAAADVLVNTKHAAKLGAAVPQPDQRDTGASRGSPVPHHGTGPRNASLHDECGPRQPELGGDLLHLGSLGTDDVQHGRPHHRLIDDFARQPFGRASLR